MISIQLGGAAVGPHSGVVACPVIAGEPVGISAALLPAEVADEVTAMLAETGHTGSAGTTQVLPRPLREPAKLLLVGVGTGDPAGWRQAGAAAVRAAARAAELTVLAPVDLSPQALGALAEGAWLGSYQYRLNEAAESDQPKITTLTIALAPTAEREQALRRARTVAQQTIFARDLTNTPSLVKTPAWFVEQVRQRAQADLDITVLGPKELAEQGFGGILAVGAGSAHEPYLLQVIWSPEDADRHVVLVGKGITFDTGGIDIKPTDGMKLMRKDMGGAAAVIGAVLGAAELELPVRVTALAPLAENMVSGSAWRPGDVVTHYGGLTSEVHSTDAEGRVVLGDAMAYAVHRLAPDVLIDLATLTGASRIALGKKIAALFGEDDELIEALTRAADAVGERVWRLPLADDYVKDVAADIADLNNAAGNPGTITAALYLREFAGAKRGSWAHIDMSAPAWSGAVEGELVKGATGWGVRTLLRYLSDLR